MLEHSAIHFYLNWAKERIDEMDATLASLETKASKLQADARAKANQALADMRKRDQRRDSGHFPGLSHRLPATKPTAAFASPPMA